MCSEISRSERRNSTDIARGPYLRRKIRSFRPKIIIVQLGGNDLCIPNTRPEVFACELKEWMETLMGHHGHIKHAFICELFVRRTTRGVNVHTYESRRTIVNKMLKALIDTEENMTFWRHLRLMNSPLDVFGQEWCTFDRIRNQKNSTEVCDWHYSMLYALQRRMGPKKRANSANRTSKRRRISEKTVSPRNDEDHDYSSTDPSMVQSITAAVTQSVLGELQ